MNEVIIKIEQKLQKNRNWIIPVLAFIAGCVCAGLFFARPGSVSAGKYNKRYDNQHGRAVEIIGQLEQELARERENNTRAREIAGSLTDAARRDVRNLQDAVGLIGEIREKVKVLEDFYTDSSPGSGSN